MIPDLTSRSLSETQTLFCTDTRSSSLGVAGVGTLKLDLRALKCRNPIFFLRIPFYALQCYHNHTNPVGCIDTLMQPEALRFWLPLTLNFFHKSLLIKQFWIVKVIYAECFDWFIWLFDTEWFGFILS